MAGILDDDFHPSFNSSADQDEFPDNRPDSFQVKLPCQFQFFNEDVKAALHYISIPTKWKVINDNNDTFETRKVHKTINLPKRTNYHSTTAAGKFISQGLKEPISTGYSNYRKGLKEYIKQRKKERAEAVARGETVPEEDESEYERDESMTAFDFKLNERILNALYPEPILNPKGADGELSVLKFNKSKHLDVRSYFKKFYQLRLNPAVHPYINFNFKIDDSIEIDDIPNNTFEIEIEIKPQVLFYDFPATHSALWKHWGIPDDKIGKSLTQGFSFFAPNFINTEIAIRFNIAIEILPETPITIVYTHQRTRKIEQGWRTESDVKEFIEDLNTLANFEKDKTTTTTTTTTVSVEAGAGVAQEMETEDDDDDEQQQQQQQQQPQQQQQQQQQLTEEEMELEEDEEDEVKLSEVRELFSLSRFGHLKLDLPDKFEIKFNGLLGNLLGFQNDEWISNTSAYTVSKKMFTLHPVTSFYLYCNILKPVITSGGFTELLSEIVPHREIPGTSSSDVTPYYPIRLAYKRLPLNSSFNIIGFKITDQYGEDVDFIGGETSITLHFIRTKKNIVI